MTTATEPVVDLRREVARCGQSFPYFLGKHVYIQDPPPGLNRQKWLPWPYLVDLAGLFQSPEGRLLVILKARQLGVSWLVAAYVVWKAIFWPGSVILLLSQGELEAKLLLSKCRYVFNNLPDYFSKGLPLEKDNEKFMQWKSPQDSEIHALPSTDKAGTGFTASLVVADELAKHEYAAKNYSALEPTINKGGQFIGLSSAFGVGNFFHQHYTAAKEGLNRFKHLFLSALLRPGRDMAWYEATKLDYESNPEIAHLFPQEYPLKDSEAFVTTVGIPVFDRLSMERIVAGTTLPIFEETDDLGYLRIWQHPIPGRRYVCGTDVSYGYDTPDAGVSHVVDWMTGVHVASIWGHYPPETLAQKTVEVCKQYNNAFLGVETNGVGVFALRRVLDMGYSSPRLLFYSDWNDAKLKGEMPKKAGWSTNAGTRPVMIAEFAEAVRTGGFVTKDEMTVSEMQTFIFDRRGRPEHALGCNDDRVFAAAIAWQMRQLAGAARISGRKRGGTRSFMRRR